jgi:hypothetical protein
MEILERIDNKREVAIYDDPTRVQAARTELLKNGFGTWELTVLDAKTAALTRYADGAPIPEAIGGAILGVLLTSTLTIHPALAPIVNPFSSTFLPVVAVGAVIGAIVSFVVAHRSRPVVLRRELGPNEYALVVPLTTKRRPVIQQIIERHRPRAREHAA